MYHGNKIAKFQRFDKFKQQLMKKGDSKMNIDEIKKKYFDACAEIGQIDFNLKTQEDRKLELLKLCSALKKSAADILSAEQSKQPEAKNE